MTVDTVFCRECCFYSTSRPFLNEELQCLYHDYRSEKYDHDREVFEPGYTESWSSHFKDPMVAEARQAKLNKYLEKYISSPNAIRHMLDWGGGDGKCMPSLFPRAKRYVFEVSSQKPAEGISKISITEHIKTYDYIQLSQVLEHLPQPKQTILDILKHLRKKGYLYIDVPAEIDEQDLERRVATKQLILDVHEHINKYCLESLSGLARSLGLAIVDKRRDGDIYRLLCQKD
jgi:hypothetical protein